MIPPSSAALVALAMKELSYEPASHRSTLHVGPMPQRRDCGRVPAYIWELGDFGGILRSESDGEPAASPGTRRTSVERIRSLHRILLLARVFVHRSRLHALLPVHADDPRTL